MRKKMPLIKNIECMNLLSQILMKQCKEFLETSRGKEGPSTIFVQTKLGIMQTADTFDQIYKVLLTIMDIQRQIKKAISDISGENEKDCKFRHSMSISLLNEYEKQAGFIYHDMKFVLLSNLDALVRDGRMTLAELNESRTITTLEGSKLFEDTTKLYKILIYLDKQFEKSDLRPEDLGLDSR